MLEHEYGVVVEKAQLSLEAVAISEFEAELLRCQIGAPAMLERHLAFDSIGRPVDYGHDVYRGDRVRFITDFATLPQDVPDNNRTQLVAGQSRHLYSTDGSSIAVDRGKMWTKE